MNKLFLGYLEALPLDTIVALWNEFVEEQELREQYIWDNIESFIETEDVDTVTVAQMVHYGWIEDWDDRVYLNDYGSFHSFSDLAASPIELKALAEWLEGNQHKVFLNWQKLEA